VRRRLIVSYVTVAAVILLVLEVPLGVIYARHERDVATTQLTRDAATLAAVSEQGMEHGSVDLTAVAQRYRAAGGDVAVFDARGALVVQPRGDEPELASAPVRARVEAVLAGALGSVHTMPGDELFAVAPIGSADRHIGVVAVSQPDARVDRRIHAAWLGLALLALVVLAAVTALGIVVARSVARPLTHLERVARRLGAGQLAARANAARGPHEVQALGRAFNDMAERLEDLVAGQQAFVADASHQLRSPLTALRLRLENVAASLPPAAADDVDDVLAEADRLSRVIDGLLALARAEGLRPQRESVDVGAVVDDRSAAWAPLAEEAGLELGVDPASPGGVTVAFVPGYLEQILDNLLANALEATPAGRHVRLRVHTEGPDVEVHVIDEGPGMGEDERRHAFDRFWRGPASRPGWGSGLGLAIVRQLARAGGAEVELREAAGGGIDAVVRLTARAPARQPSGQTPGAAVAGPAPALPVRG